MSLDRFLDLEITEMANLAHYLPARPLEAVPFCS